MQVNISPSLHSQSPLDAHVKGPLIKTLFDMAQFHIPPKTFNDTENDPDVYDPRLYSMALKKNEKTKHADFLECSKREEVIFLSILYEVSSLKLICS